MLTLPWGLSRARLMHAIYGAIRTRALVILRRRCGPVWDDPLEAACKRIEYPGKCDRGRIWVVAANHRHDLVRFALGTLSGRPPLERPRLIIVACDPASREHFAARAQDWRHVFGVGFDLWLPDVPVAPGHLAVFCRRLADRGAVLLSPAEALFEQDVWLDQAFEALQRGAMETFCWSEGHPSLDGADRVAIMGWGRRLAKPGCARGAPMVAGWPAVSAPAWWAPITNERLPALTPHTHRFNLQAWLYRYKEPLFSIAARTLLLVGLPRHKSYVHVADCFFIPNGGWFLAGSIVDPFHAVSRLTLAHPDDANQVDLSEYWSRVPQPVLDRLYQQFHLPEPPRGFVAFIPLDVLGESGCLPELLLREYRGRNQRRQRIPVQPLPQGKDSLRTLLESFSPDRVRLRELMSRQVARPIELLWGQRPGRCLAARENLDKFLHRIGPVPGAPRVSIVVPIFGRWDFMRYQMDSFGRDPALRRIEWIYVVDDPSLGQEVLASAEALYVLFNVPFILVYCGENLGFSGACNLGVRAAKGQFVVLMNSDVFPIADGWLEPMIDALGEGVGAVGARLLYEDYAVQHAGMAFEPLGAWQGLKIITHPGKGVPDRLLGANHRFNVGATAACLLMRRADYSAIGGLSEDFVIGDFEDGDLCVRLGTAGKSVVTVSSARLYHLERQSIRNIGDNHWREMLTLYNCWLFNRRLEGATTENSA
ncbi:MAG: glycosyltransferase family 2 protein [Caldilineaceae bacterium]